MKSDHTSENKVELFQENNVVVEGGWFDDTDLTDGATFKTYLIKRSKLRINRIKLT